MTVNKSNFAIERMRVWNDTVTRTFRSDPVYRRNNPYAQETCLESRWERRYEPIAGKYTLVFLSSCDDVMEICHNEYRWKDAPTRQHSNTRMSCS